MIRVALLFAAGAVGLAVLAPSVFEGGSAPSTAGPGPATATPPADDAAAKGADRQAAGYREASIEADPRGQYSAEAIVDGLPVRMMIDTGASVVTISASTAARLGLSATSGPKWTVKTANGMTVASPVTLDSLSLGGLYMNRVEALILGAEAGDVNLIGASFLRRLVSVEQRDGVLILRQ
jgi:aspartyl protease family protein